MEFQQMGMSPILFLVLPLALGAWKVISWINYFSQRAKVDAQFSAGKMTTECATGDSNSAATKSRDAASAIVCIYRIPSFVGWLNPNYIYCDKVPVTNVKNGRHAICRVDPGQHAFSSSLSASTISLSLDSGQEYFIRSGFTGLTNFVFEAVSQEQAQPQISRLKQVSRDLINAKFT